MITLLVVWKTFQIELSMGRVYGPGKGISGSAIPYTRVVPSWLKLSSDECIEHIGKLAKKGLTPSQIGVVLRDSHGVPQVRFLTGNKILRILKSRGMAPEIPEDLYHLIKKAVSMRSHLDKNRKDIDTKYRLILVESRIHRLARYYKKKRQLPTTWKYESKTAAALVAWFLFWFRINSWAILSFFSDFIFDMRKEVSRIQTVGLHSNSKI